MHTKGVGAELREKQPPACMVVWYNKRQTNKYEKHFPKMYRDVGMAVPKTIQTRYMGGSVQATQRTTQVTPSLHHFFLIERVSKICCQSTGNSFGRITKMKNDVGMGLLV